MTETLTLVPTSVTNLPEFAAFSGGNLPAVISETAPQAESETPIGLIIAGSIAGIAAVGGLGWLLYDWWTAKKEVATKTLALNEEASNLRLAEAVATARAEERAAAAPAPAPKATAAPFTPEQAQYFQKLMADQTLAFQKLVAETVAAALKANASVPNGAAAAAAS